MEVWGPDLFESMEKNASVTNLPGAFYFSDYLWKDAPEEQQNLFEYCTQLPKSKRGYISGNSGPKVTVLSDDEPFPEKLSYLLEKLKERKFFNNSPVQISINEYSVGDRMIPHKDGLGHFGAIVSLGSSSILDFYYKPAEFDLTHTVVFSKNKGDRSEMFTIESKPNVSVFMEPGSLLIISGDAFINYVHAIDARDTDTIDETVGNLHLCDASRKLGLQVPRTSPRISLVLWDSRDVINVDQLDHQKKYII